MMSIDVDDLHAAEDVIGEIRAELGSVLDMTIANTGARLRIIHALAVAAEYCRPSCGMNGAQHITEDGYIDVDNDCECSCHRVAG